MEFTSDIPVETADGFECKGLAEKKCPITFFIPVSLIPEIRSYTDALNLPLDIVVRLLFEARISQAIETRLLPDKIELGQLHRLEIAGLFSDVRAANRCRPAKLKASAVMK